MNVEALKWYRNNSNYTENSSKVGKQPILYFDTQKVPGGRNRYVDVAGARDGLTFFGTPSEYGAKFAASKYISVVSPPDKGKVMFTNYSKDPNLTNREVFPGLGQNNNGRTEASPFHLVKLYFPGRASLRLDTNPNSNNYKNWL